MSAARYDGQAEWYDGTLAEYGDLEREGSSSAHLVRLLGDGAARHATLSELLGALLDSGLRLVGIEEGDTLQPFANRLGLVAVRDD